jgi:hypothetical protein
VSVEIIELEMDSEEGMLFAWGVHEPAAFLSACAVYGVEADDTHRVKHERYIKVKPKGGRFDAWYEPVQGEPNATILLP